MNTGIFFGETFAAGPMPEEYPAFICTGIGRRSFLRDLPLVFAMDLQYHESTKLKKQEDRRMRKIKAVVVMLVVMLCVTLLTGVLAATSTEKNQKSYDGDAALQQQLNDLPPFKFENHKYGIGYGSCPVYTAPSLDAYRCANGKASCSTDDPMADGGFVNGWLLVRYETNKGNYRVGYIPPQYVRNFKSSMYPHFGYIPAVADDYIPVTDNPMTHGTSFAEIAPGEAFHVISRYNYHQKNGLDWWYIECEVDGQIAYGFIEYADARFHLGEPEQSVGGEG